MIIVWGIRLLRQKRSWVEVFGVLIPYGGVRAYKGQRLLGSKKVDHHAETQKMDIPDRVVLSIKSLKGASQIS